MGQESTTTIPSPEAAQAESRSLPGAAVIARIRRVLLVAIVSSLAYSVVMLASKGMCAGGISADGGFVDATGAPTSNVPMCIDLRLGPSVVVYLAVAAIVLAVLGRVIARAADTADAFRMLDRAAIAIGVVVTASAIIAHVWFALIPIEGFGSGSYTFWYPFPFGAVETTVTPMSPAS